MGGLFLFYVSVAALVSQFGQAFSSIYIGR
jgi:flagellar biosynthetic protein FliR